MAIKIQYTVGMAWSMAFAAFIVNSFELQAFTPDGLPCVNEATRFLAQRIKTLKGRLPVKEKETESKGKESHTSSIDWSKATGKQSVLSPFERLFAGVLKDYGDFVDYGIAKAIFLDEFRVGESRLLPHDGTVQDLWAWSVERASEQIATRKAKEEAEKATQPTS